jgi:hypothetical protein
VSNDKDNRLHSPRQQDRNEGQCFPSFSSPLRSCLPSRLLVCFRLPCCAVNQGPTGRCRFLELPEFGLWLWPGVEERQALAGPHKSKIQQLKSQFGVVACTCKILFPINSNRHNACDQRKTARCRGTAVLAAQGKPAVAAPAAGSFLKVLFVVNESSGSLAVPTAPSRSRVGRVGKGLSCEFTALNRRRGFASASHLDGSSGC